jgi:hypothetical protein
MATSILTTTTISTGITLTTSTVVREEEDKEATVGSITRVIVEMPPMTGAARTSLAIAEALEIAEALAAAAVSVDPVVLAELAAQVGRAELAEPAAQVGRVELAEPAA